MGKILDVLQWSLILVAVATGLFISWKFFVLGVVLSGTIGIARLHWQRKAYDE